MQLYAAIDRAWAEAAAQGCVAVAPRLHATCEAYTEQTERITRASQLRDGDVVVYATAVDLRPYMATPDKVGRYDILLLRWCFTQLGLTLNHLPLSGAERAGAATRRARAGDATCARRRQAPHA